MKKVVDFIEMYVQWIALALGGLFLVYMIYSYAVQTPVLVGGIGASPLNPGDVDTTILSGPAQKLQQAIKDPRVPQMAVPDMMKSLAPDPSDNASAPHPLSLAFGSTPVENAFLTGPNTKSSSPTAVALTELPQIPSATVLDYSSGKSNVQLPTGQAAGNAAVPVANTADRAWITVRYSISPKQIADAFAKVNVPAWTERTAVLQVSMEREELLPNGQMSAPKIIPPLNEAALLSFPTNPAEEADYFKWAPDHIAEIMQPAFLTVVKGDTWMMPGEAAAVVPVALAPLDPTRDYPPNILNQYPETDRLAYNRAHTALRQAQQPRRPRPVNTGTGSSGNSGPAGVILDPDRPRDGEVFYAPGPGQIQSNQGPADVPPNQGGQAQGADQPPNMPGGNGSAAATAANSLPQGAFDPNQFSGDLIGWAHDITVEPGHTYQYRISFKLQNPVYHTNAAKNPQIVNTFALTSAESAWTAPVSVANSTNFFLASNSRAGTTSARFKVFKWENGVERMKEFGVEPGDIIGSKDATGDYSTGATVVALRFDDPKNPDGMTVLVMDNTGRIEQRDYRSDQANPALNALSLQVQAQTAATPAASGANSGVTQGGGPPG